MSARSTSRPRLTVAILARNAQDLLAATLESVEFLADEILVTDTGSSDSTCDVARRYGAQLLERPWLNDFGKMRNNARSNATGDWILWLDAGERLTHESAHQLRKFLNEEADRSKAYMFLVVVPPAPGTIAGEQIGRIRLVPNRADVRFTGRVREQLRPSLEAAGLAVEGLPFRILRSSSDHDPQVKLLKARRDLKLLEADINELGQQPHLLAGLGECLSNLGDHTSAIACFRKAIQHAVPGSSVMRESYYGLLSCYDEDESQRQAQIALCLEALDLFPLDAQLLCAMGGYMQAQQRLDLAVRSYQTAMDYGQVDPETWHVGDIHEIAAVCLNLTQQMQELDDDALATLTQALERSPQSLRLRRYLIDLHIKHNRRKEALEEFDNLPADMPMREALRGVIRGACLAARENWTPALAYLQTAFGSGCRDSLCLRWLAVTQMALNDLEGALPTIKAWQAVEPRNAEAQRYLESIEAELPPQLPPGSDAPPARRIRIDGPNAAGENELRVHAGDHARHDAMQP